MFNCLKARSRKFHRGALAATLLGLACFAGMNSLAGSLSPVGTWDLNLSGAMQGIAYISFDESGGLSGYELINPKSPAALSTDRGATDQSRTNDLSNSSSNIVLQGFAMISGNWAFDQKGRVVGIYTEGGDNRECVTNTEITTVVTNTVIDFGTNVVTVTLTNYVTNVVTTCVTNAVTNGLSFVATVRPNSMTMKSTTTYGNVTLHGKQAIELADISGNYFATGRKTGAPDFNEFISLTPSEFFNVYYISGIGAGYEVSGVGVISSTKRLGIALLNSATNSSLTTGVGTYNYRRGSADIGTQDGNSVLGRYKIYHQ